MTHRCDTSWYTIHDNYMWSYHIISYHIIYIVSCRVVSWFHGLPCPFLFVLVDQLIFSGAFLAWKKTSFFFFFNQPICDGWVYQQIYGMQHDAKSIKPFGTWSEHVGTCWNMLEEKVNGYHRPWRSMVSRLSSASPKPRCYVLLGQQVMPYLYIVLPITYGPHKAVAEVSNHNEPIGRKYGIQLVRKSMDFTFSCFVLKWLTD